MKNDDDLEIDIMEIENDVLEILESTGVDPLSEFAQMSAAQMATEAIRKEKQKKEEKKLLKQKQQEKRAHEERMKWIAPSNDFGKKCYDLLVTSYPQFDDDTAKSMHWSGALTRILNIIGYKPVVEVLANITVAGSVPNNIAIVKSHLCQATFDNIWSQMGNWVEANPFVSPKSLEGEKEVLGYVGNVTYSIDTNSPSFDDPEFGAF